MKKIKVSEIFYSIQGEGKYVGVPSVFLRTFGCNFKCEGFGMPPGEKSTERFDVAFGPETKTLHDLPLVSTGCDSYASWDVRFKNLSPTYTAEEIARNVFDLVPGHDWRNTHLIITGGEPLLGWQRAYVDLLERREFNTLENITFETNGTQELHEDVFRYMGLHRTKKFTFSVSPKLSASGEDWNDAVRPEIVAEYDLVGDVYLKFVCDTEEHIMEALDAVSDYRNAGINPPVYIMPTGGMAEEYKENAPKIAALCMKHQLFYSPRLHVDLFGNAWAT